MKSSPLMKNLEPRICQAVLHYWGARVAQQKRQRKNRISDQGSRRAVTGGVQMDGFIDLFSELIVEIGISPSCIFRKGHVELPGFFRPTKEWDLLVIRDHTLLVAIEAKSQAGPSFGNNFNNRAEEAMGSALDLWTAFRERAYLASPQPFLGYFFMLEDCNKSNCPVKVKEPHFKVFPEFVDASYRRRYEIFCRKLVLERHYSAAAYITSDPVNNRNGNFATPAQDLSLECFAKVLLGHLFAFV